MYAFLADLSNYCKIVSNCNMTHMQTSGLAGFTNTYLATLSALQVQEWTESEMAIGMVYGNLKQFIFLLQQPGCVATEINPGHPTHRYY